MRPKTRKTCLPTTELRPPSSSLSRKTNASSGLDRRLPCPQSFFCVETILRLTEARLGPTAPTRTIMNATVFPMRADAKQSASKSKAGAGQLPAQRILVVDDEDDLLELVRYNLTKEGFEVECTGTGEEALRSARRQPPDLIVLDWMLPNVDGLEVCRRLKGDSKTREIPIVMLTAKGEESDMIVGLERGADDYIAKPFSPKVLAARVRALLRRHEARRREQLETTIEVHELAIHPGRHEVMLAGQPLELTYTEFALLQFLAKRPGWAYTRMQIVDAVKGEDYPVTERSVDVQVAGLRKKLGTFGSSIETVRGVGYRFRA